MELWDIYDKERVNTGRTIERGKQLGADEFHLAVHVCIFRYDGKMLIQQRQSFKDDWPNLWDVTIGGCALAGESSHMAAERELYEEIGCRADLSNQRPFITMHFDGGFDDYYLIEKDIDIDTLTLQQEEVKRVKWATEEEISQMIRDGVFVPYYVSLIEVLFNMRTHRGAHRI